MAMNHFMFSRLLRCTILGLKLSLLLIAVDRYEIADGHDVEDIECDEEKWKNTDITSMKCYTQCSADCTCLLANDEVLSNCTGGHVTLAHVIYLPNMTSLSWKDSILHEIQPETFLRFENRLERLDLNNLSLHRLQHGVFAGLEGLKYLNLDYNKLHRITSGTFENLVQLKHLSLSNNMLTDIQIGMFRGLISLEQLDLQYNMLCGIEQNAFNELIQLQELWLDHNLLKRIETGVFQNLAQLQTLSLSDNLLSEIQINQYNGLRSLKILSLFYNSISVI